MFKSKKLVALGLAAVALFSTVGVSLAYWASSVNGADDTATGTVNVGTGDTVTTVVNVADEAAEAGKVLVPAGLSDGADKVESITLTFSVLWNDEDALSDGAIGNLAVTVDEYAVGSGTDTYNLVNIDLPVDADITAGTAYDVDVSVSIDMPANLDEYNSIAGKAIVITFSFDVTVA